MMIDKRFKIHSMIQDMEVGEIMDLELCEELIRKYGSLSDIHVLIEDNGNDMTYQEVVDLLNENEQLKQENKKLQGKCDHSLWLYNGLGCEYDGLKDENEQLKQGLNDDLELIVQLQKENEQLKQCNTELVHKIDFLERIVDGDLDD